MKSILHPFLFFIAFLYCATCTAQPENTNLSNDIIFDGEPYLAINPTNNQNLVVTWMGETLSGTSLAIAITIRASFDGGNTWSAIATLPHHSPTFGSADVSLAFDKTGLLYLSYIDFDQATATGGDYITRSFNGGLNWDTGTEVTDVNDVPGKAPIDRPWLVVDNSNTSHAGTLYITSKPAYFIAPPNRNYYRVSTDSGYTWSPIANVDGGNYLVGNIIPQPMATPATTINGNFCAVYPSYLSSQNILPAYYLATSNNQGQSFSYTTVIAALAAPIDTNLKAGYRLAANPADSNQLAFFAVDGYLGEPDIFGLHSNDGGQTWSSRIKVNDDSTGDGKDHDMVWCTYNEQGSLLATWRDRRNASVDGFWNAGYDFYYAISNDNGQTFSANQLLSSQFIAFDSVIALKGNDFMTCAYLGDTLYSVWGDTRTGALNIYFVKTLATSDSVLAISLLQGNEPAWSALPNPVHASLFVRVSSQMIGKKISIYDASGKIVSTLLAQNLQTEINTACWSPGAYYIKVANAVRKIVKQ